MHLVKTTRGKRLLDRLALLVCALLLIAVGGSAFLLADKHHVSEAWVFGAWAALFFFFICGLGIPTQFPKPRFHVVLCGLDPAACGRISVDLGLSGFPVVCPNCGVGTLDRLYRCDFAVRPSTG